MPLRAVTLLAMLLPAVLACVTVQHEPKDFDLDRAWPPVEVQGGVSVRSGSAEAELFTIDLAGANVTVDRQMYTDSLAERVEAALRERRAAVSSDAPKSVELVVVYVNILPGAGRFHCVIDFTLRAGDGYVRGLQARANSMSFLKSCDAALSEAALTCLSDPHLQEYLASPVAPPGSPSNG